MSEVAPGIQLLLLPTPFPVGPVNVYLLEGQPLTLVDVGPRTPEAWQALEEGLARAGYDLSQIEQVVITHAHHDHFGQARDVIEASGAALLSFRENKYPLEQFETWWERRIDFVAALMLKEGAPPESLSEMEVIKGFAQYAASVSPVTPLDDNDELPMGGRTWRVLHTPGHARGELCLYREQERLLISGDHLLRDITANPVLETPRAGMTERPRSLPDYIQSLRRIRELEVELVLPGHGDVVYDHRALVDEILVHHQVRGALILQLLRERDHTVYELGVALFGGRLPGVELFLVMSEIIGHLDVLELEGKVKRVDTGPVAVWAALD
ncbi:MAG TPA: MBL fold metallo-hydrolase [Chloroflexi bacterium]|nr:MBL fold metallo-hydrolase [Chloroflexota bacterium]